MTFRAYDPARDKEAAYRIWREIGWIKRGQEEVMDVALEAGRAMVAEMDGSAECLVSSAKGTLRYLNADLPFAGLTGVATSRVARRQHFAGRLTALTVALDAADGAVVHGLGMFDQGFYNRLGFGTGAYEHRVRFDPAQLVVPVCARPPKRLDRDDWEAMHNARLRRHRPHGGVNLQHPGATRHEVLAQENGFGLGYWDGTQGELTHFVWCDTERPEHGPYNVQWLAYRTPEQFLELMGVLKSLSDQVHLVTMQEPPEVQLQDLMKEPFKHHRVTERSPYEVGIASAAWWQMRICNLTACLEHTHLDADPVRFNLVLGDPIEEYLPEDAPWRGIAGEYVVVLGVDSGAQPGRDLVLPTLRATVDAFTRLWLGVRPASGLAITDRLEGPPDLLHALDRVLRLPRPCMDWDF